MSMLTSRSGRNALPEAQRRRRIRVARARPVAAMVLSLVAATPALGGVVVLEDREAWMEAAGSFTTIDFTGYPRGTIVTDQYEDLGITFGPFQMYVQQTSSAFPSDGFGLSGVGNSPIGFSFFEPQTWVGVDYPGGAQIELYSQGELIYQSGFYLPPGDSNFLGVLSPAPFDMVIVRCPAGAGQANIDNLYFGVPAPSALSILGMALWRRRGRRRASC